MNYSEPQIPDIPEETAGMPRFYLVHPGPDGGDEWTAVGATMGQDPIAISAPSITELVFDIATVLDAYEYEGLFALLNTNNRGMIFTNEPE